MTDLKECATIDSSGKIKRNQSPIPDTCDRGAQMKGQSEMNKPAPFGDGEDWHLLEADLSDHQQQQQQQPLIEQAIDLNGNLSSSIQAHSKGKQQPQQLSQVRYIELDPLGQSRDHYSPILVHLCTAIYSLLPLASALSALALLALLFTRFYYLSLAYLLYVFLDRNTCNKGGRRIEWIYQSRFWSLLAAYFPIKLRHPIQFKLDPQKNYILNYHPHGIAAFGSVATFATNGLHFGSLFAGIKPRFMVHESSFIMPVMKETFALRGDCSVNSKSIDYMLSRAGTGNLLAIVVGGLAEADLSNAELLKVVILRRKGFIKKALIHGAHIIPCIAFGENSVFHKVDLKAGTLLHRMESKFYQLFKFKHPIYFGRSIVTPELKGVMPYRRPITVVMGQPIQVDRIASPSQEDIDRLHETYIAQLKTMYSENSDLCSVYDKVMELV